jgi:hypothetical protein
MLRKDNDPNGWRRVWAEESARQPERAGPVDIAMRFVLGFCCAFAPLWAITEMLFNRGGF